LGKSYTKYRLTQRHKSSVVDFDEQTLMGMEAIRGLGKDGPIQIPT
jgi:hypothetical protein